MNQLVLKNRVYSHLKLLVFDMSGTIINDSGIVYQTLYQILNNNGIPVALDEIPRWYGLSKRELVRRYVKDEKLVSQFNKNLMERCLFGDEIRLIDSQLPELFHEIRNHDIKIALNTSYQPEIQTAIISKLKLERVIDDYISSEEVLKDRPYPYMIDTLRRRHGIPNPGSVIKIGDTTMDILEGINAKCGYTIGVLSGLGLKKNLKMADLILDNVMDIKTN